MNNLFKRTTICCMALLCVLLTACNNSKTPPSVEEVESAFYENQDDLNTIIQFLEESGYNKVQIEDDNGKMWADFEDNVPINNEKANAAIDHLIGTGTYLWIHKRANTVEIAQWKPLVYHMDCGLAYTGDDKLLPEIQYMTEIVPLEEPGWYYYVVDYEKSRLQD